MIITRQGIRAILLTSANEVLLIRIRAPHSRECFWIAPGGGIEAGESGEVALRREIKEEVGLAPIALGPLVWRRQHTFNWDGRRICQREHYHVVHVVDRFAPQMADAREARTLDRFRWWSIDEMVHTGERLTPLSLADIVTRYLASGAPAIPPDWEVLVD